MFIQEVREHFFFLHLFLVFESLQTSLLCIVRELAGGGFVAVAVAVAVPEPASVYFILHTKHCTMHTTRLFCLLHIYHFTLHTAESCLSLLARWTWQNEHLFQAKLRQHDRKHTKSL